MKARFAEVGFSAVAMFFAAGCGSGLGTIQGVAPPCPGASGHANSLAHPTVEIWKGKSEVEAFDVRMPWGFHVNRPPGVYTVTMVDSAAPMTVTVLDSQTIQARLESDCG